MTAPALQSCLRRHADHAAATLRLDEELGTLHGIAWADFVLLDLLESAGGTATAAELAPRLGLLRSRFLLQLLPLEKLGLVARTVDGAARQVTLRAPGRRLLHEARETAAAVCEKAGAAA